MPDLGQFPPQPKPFFQKDAFQKRQWEGKAGKFSSMSLFLHVFLTHNFSTEVATF